MSRQINYRSAFCHVLFLSLFLLIAVSAVAVADVHLPNVFGDHMVLQRDMPINIWGTADPAEVVKVTLGKDSGSATADSSGNWAVKLAPLPAGAPLTLVVTGKNTVTLEDVMMGEVWVCSGQSNMEFGIGMANNHDAEIAAADHPQIRLLLVPHQSSFVPVNDVNAKWAVCSPDTIKQGGWSGFSAGAYFFGRELQQKLNVPVGLIESAWGGTPIEAWITPEAYATAPDATDIATRLKDANTKYIADLTKANAYTPDVQNGLASGVAFNPLPGNLQPYSYCQGQTLYLGMIHPLTKLSVRGAIWYQGEANVGQGMRYFDRMKLLIGGWRAAFNEPSLAFYYVQIAPFKYGGDPTAEAGIWDAQRVSLTIPNTGMAVTTDIATLDNIHPPDKQDVGHRLAAWALAKTYKEKNIVYTGPLFQSAKIAGNTVTVSFTKDSIGSGISTRDGQAPTDFELSGLDGTFFAADAAIKGDTVIVTSNNVPKPVQVHFAWNQLDNPNLINKEGLPASPFTSPLPTMAQLYGLTGPDLALAKPFTSSDTNLWGWNTGLTDGSWDTSNVNCYASGNADAFPKTVTIDLQALVPVNAVAFGVPPFGSTHNVDVSISADGTTFTKVGSHEFSLRKAERTAVTFAATKARYVRLTYLDHYPDNVGYDPTFVFTTEVEAYGPKK
jgi:sialate O-acetylesterase